MNAARRREILISAAQYDGELESAKVSILELAPAALRLGAQGVEYRTVYWRDREREIPAVREQLAELRLKATYATFTTLYNRDPEKQLQLLRDLDDAHALGSPLLRVFLGERPGDGPHDAPIRDAVWRVIDRAGDHGMRLALENFNGTPGNRMTEIKEAIDRLNSPIMGVNIDTSNYAKHGQDPVEAIHLLAPWIVYCHLKDARPTEQGLVTTYPGNGNMDLRAVMAAIDAIGREFPICFEFPGEGDPERVIRKGLEFLAGL